VERFFAPCPRGLEAALGDELTRLDASSIAPVDGGVGFEGPLDLAYRANLESRLASRVLWRVGHGPYRDERELNALAMSIDWTQHFRADRTIRVDVAATRSPLRSLEFATLTIKDAVADRFRDAQGKRPSVDKRAPDVRVNAYLTDREATFYLDTSGEPLFKRGWRRDAEDAPMRENLAAGIIALTGWQPGAAFLDPMCGSGTIAIEAATIAADRAPGLTRTFGFQKLTWFDGPTWQRLKQRARDRIKPPPPAPSVFASDRLAAAVATTRRNAALAQVEQYLAIEQVDALVRGAPAPSGTLVANPPYGIRLDDKARIAQMYPKLGDALKARYAGWTAWLFSGDTDLPKKIGLKAERRIPLWNGAIECRLYGYRIVSGKLDG